MHHPFYRLHWLFPLALLIAITLAYSLYKILSPLTQPTTQ